MVAGISPSPGQTSGAFRGHAPSYRIDHEGNILTSYGEFAGNDMFFFEGMAGT